MKYLIVCAIILPFCAAIEVKFLNRYVYGVKKVEIPSCSEEPCVLHKGKPLNVSITVETASTSKVLFDNFTDMETTLSIDGYRNSFVYSVAKRQLFCETEPKQCPLVLPKTYTINREVFLSRDEDEPLPHHWSEGSRNGNIDIDISVVLLQKNGSAWDWPGSAIGDASFVLDVQKD